MPIPSICWLAAFIILVLVEAATVGLVSLWFALGALAGLITSFWVNNIWVQLGIFLGVSLVALLVIRPLARRYITPRQVATNADRAVGAEGVVTQAIDNLKASGQVTVQGSVWTARAQGDVFIPVGTTVKVLRIEGVKLIVSPVAEAVPR